MVEWELHDVLTHGRYNGKPIETAIKNNPYYMQELVESGGIALAPCAATLLQEQLVECQEAEMFWSDGIYTD